MAPLLALLSVAGCSRNRARPVERLAILPFENLSSDSSLDWLGAAAPYVIAAQATGSERLVPLQPEIDRENALRRGTRILRGYYYTDAGQLRIRAVLFDAASNQALQRMEAQAPLSQGPVAPLGQVAHDMVGFTRPFPASLPALENFGRAMLETDPAARLELARKGLAADAKLVPAALAVARIEAARGDRAAAVQALSASLAQTTEAASRLQLELVLAELNGDRAKRTQVLDAAAKLTPKDADVWQRLGEAQVQNHSFPAAAQAYRKAAELRSEDDGLWNAIAYTEAYAGNFDEALRYGEIYRKLVRLDPNAYDTMGELHWMAGRFKEAEENFLEAQQRDPQFLGGQEFAKAAFARVMAGDVPGADGIFHRYLESRQALKDPLAELRKAHWLLLTGRKKEGVALLDRLAAEPAELGARSGVLLAVELLLSGNRARAKELAVRANQQGQAPGTKNAALMLALLASAGDANEVSRTLPQETPQSFRDLTLAYGLVFGGNWKAAIPVLAQLEQQMVPAQGDEVRALLAGAKAQTGDKTGAKALLRRWPLPPGPGETVFAQLWFPRLREWHQ